MADPRAKGTVRRPFCSMRRSVGAPHHTKGTSRFVFFRQAPKFARTVRLEARAQQRATISVQKTGR